MVTSVLAVAFIFPCLILLFKYNWKRRWLYYYASKFPGPTSLPLVGTLTLITTDRKVDFVKTIRQMCDTYPPVFRLWIGNDLYIVNSNPEDVEILLNTFLEKSPFYAIWDDILNKTLITAPVGKWKRRRKLINPSFNLKVLNSFDNIFVKYSKNIVKMLNDMCGKEVTNLMPEIWKHHIDTALETIIDIDPAFVERSGLITLITRSEQIIMERFHKFWLLIDFIWNLTDLRKEINTTVAKAHAVAGKALEMKMEQRDIESGDLLRKKRFLNSLIDLFKSGETFSKRELMEEGSLMLTAASETTSVTITFVVLALALFPDIQDKVYEEYSSVAEGGKEELSLDKINRMNYLECVIKETMRLLPTVSVIMRSITKDIQLGPHTFPAGSNVMIPIMHIHRRPDLWPNPLKFDPDRFLPEQAGKRHRCAYIPFSFGTRNCIGLKYAIMSMKITIAFIVKHFTIKALNYQSLEDLEIENTLLSRPVGYRIMFEKRTG